MILKALYDYYNRSGDLAPAGFEEKEIPFVIVIDDAGNFQIGYVSTIDIDDQRRG